MARRVYLPALIATALLVAAGFSIFAHTSAVCHENYRADGQLRSVRRILNIQKAVSDADKQKGLGGRSCIGADRGMLFVFDKPDYYAFWMKDMHFPIDIVWIDSDKKVIEVDQAVQPDAYPKSFQPSRPSQYVLEIGTGEAARDSFVSGGQLIF